MKLKSTFNLHLWANDLYYEVEVERYATVTKVNFKPFGWATWNTITLRGKEKNMDLVIILEKYGRKWN